MEAAVWPGYLFLSDGGRDTAPDQRRADEFISSEAEETDVCRKDEEG